MIINKLFKISAAGLLLISLLSVTVYADTAYKTITVDKNGDYIETQNAYNPVGTIEKIGDESLNAPSDLAISGEVMYIADTGNKRILVSDLDGELISVIGGGELLEPCGVFVAENGEILVADRGAKAVFAFSADGKLIKKYEKPDSPLYGKNESFIPLKVAADGNDNLYIS